MKKIIVPTDFSDCANNASDAAIAIAKKANAEIHFMHILRTPVDWKRLRPEQEKNFPDILHKIGDAKSELTNLKRRAIGEGLVTETSMVFGNDGIVNHLQDHSHDFIVMGSHGTKGFKEVIGSNTQKIVRYTSSPVLVIKNKMPDFEVKNIVFASTFEGSFKPFEKVIELADIMKAKIHLLNVNMPFHFKETDEIEAKMEGFLSKCPRGNCTINIYNALNEERGIQKFADSINAELIALTTHGKTGFMKMISPSIAESLVNHSNKAVLCVNLRNGE